MIRLKGIDKIVADNLYRMRNTHKKGRKYLFLQKPEGKFINHIWIPSDYEKIGCCMCVDQVKLGFFGTNTRNRIHARHEGHINNLIATHGVYDVVTHFNIMHKFGKENQRLIKERAII